MVDKAVRKIEMLKRDTAAEVEARHAGDAEAIRLLKMSGVFLMRKMLLKRSWLKQSECKTRLD